MLPTLPSLRDKRKLREVDFCHAFVGKFFQTAFNLWQCVKENIACHEVCLF